MERDEFFAELRRRIQSGELSREQVADLLKRKRGRPKLGASKLRKRAHERYFDIGEEFQRRIEENATKRTPATQRTILWDIAREFHVSETRANAALKHYRDTVLRVLSIQPSFNIDNPPKEYAQIARWGKTRKARKPSKSGRSTIPKK